MLAATEFGSGFWHGIFRFFKHIGSFHTRVTRACCRVRIRGLCVGFGIPSFDEFAPVAQHRACAHNPRGNRVTSADTQILNKLLLSLSPRLEGRFATTYSLKTVDKVESKDQLPAWFPKG